MKKSVRSIAAAKHSFLILSSVVLALVLAVLAAWQLRSPGVLHGDLVTVAGNEDQEDVTGSESGEAADELEAALAFEYEMVKDPATGRIPEGIHDAELAQAAELLEQQRSSDRPELGSFSFVGPDNLGGRTRALVYDRRFDGVGNQIILAGGISNGVFKSTDNGATWVRKSPVGDYYSVTALAQDPRPGFENTWYYAGGEALGNSASGTGALYAGKGIYKSTDNGETWTHLPNSNTGSLEVFDNRADFVSKLVVDPTTGFVYAGVIAGILRSTDGGATWSLVLSGTFANTSQVTDVVVTTTGRLYAALGGSNSTGTDGVWTSTSGATNSWTRIAGPAGTPLGWNANASYGRIVLGIAPSSENIVYALYSSTTSDCAAVAAPEAELFRWDNNLGTWTDLSATLPDEPGCLNGNDPFAVQGGYDLIVAVKPDDPTTVFIGGTNIYRSTTSGLTWTRAGGYVSANSFGGYLNSHSDIHAIAFQPGNPSIMICGNDGGIQRTINTLGGTIAWTQIVSGYRTYQYRYVVNDPRAGSTKVIGGAQDNGTTRNIGGAGSNFESVFGGDGVSVGLSDPAVTGGVQFEYVGSQNGNVLRRDATAASGGTSIRPTAATGNGLFVTLFKLDEDNTQTLYYANGSTLYLTTSASTVTSGTWTTMTGIAGVVGASSITAIGLSRGPYNASTSSLFIGTSNGRVFRLDNPTGAPTATPVEITGPGFPTTGTVSSISANPSDDSTLLVTFSNYGVTSVFWTGNANAAVPTWTAVEGGLTLPSYRSSAIVDTGAGGLQYFVGTSAGLYSTGNLPGSPAWTQESAGQLGNAVVTSLDLRTSDNKLLVGTHGYGMWSATLGGVVGPSPTPTATVNPSPTPTVSPSPGGTTILSYNGAPIPIPDNNASGISASFPITGLGTITDLDFSIDGTQCSNTPGATTVGLSHTWVGDIVIKLTSPQGTTITLINQAGGVNNNGVNFCQTVLGDQGTALIQSVTAAGAPYTGTFKPNSPLSAFNGQSPNGTWVLNLSDLGPGDTGSLRAFSLRITTPAATPSPTPTATATRTPTPSPTPTGRKTAFDFDADGRADVAVYRPSQGNWYLNRSTQGFYAQNFGNAADKLAPADYDGDGRADLAVYRPASGVFFIYRSSDGGDGSAYWGLPEDIPCPADFDGDGKADIAIFRPSTGSFWIRQSGSGNATLVIQYGATGDQPVVGDYDGDGKADVAVYRPTTGIWFIHKSTGGDTIQQFGIPSDKAVAGDFDGDGKTDIAVYRTQTGVWFVVNSTGGFTSYQFGFPADTPAPADYDGDGKIDMSIFRPGENNFWINGSRNGVTVIGWGVSTDIPIENAYVR